jgi:glycosyltransferase involved in cell wall biosynthesis
MKILLLSQWFDPEPGAGRGLPFAQWLRAHGEDVEVLTGFPNYPGGKVYDGYRVQWKFRETMSGVPVERVPLYPSHDRSAPGRIANYLSFATAASLLGFRRVGKSDVTYVLNNPITGVAGRLQKALRGVPYVFNIPDLWPQSVVESGMIRGGFVKRFVTNGLRGVNRVVYDNAAAITVISPGFKRILVEEGVPADKVHVVYNWIDEDLFQPVPRDEALASELGFAGKFNVVFAGNFGAYQGLDSVIRAAAMLSDVPDVQLVFIGTGQKDPELRALAAEMKLSNVRFIGRRDLTDMPKINALADVLLVHLKDLDFFRATIPSKTQVSLASGRPVIMAVRGDAADIIERANAGFVCEPENPAALAETIKRMRHTPAAEREAMGRNGRQFYQSEMSLDIGAARLHDILTQAAQKGTTR